jgi:hypothetical protein
MAVLLPENCRCSVPFCDLCVRRIGATADSDQHYDPLVLMAIGQANGVTLKLTRDAYLFDHYIVCVLHWQGEALIYDAGIQVDG